MPFGGRTTGLVLLNVLNEQANSLVDGLIYFGGAENLTNAFSRISLGNGKVRQNSLPVTILLTSSRNPDRLVVSDDIEFLKRINCRILVISINGGRSSLEDMLKDYSIDKLQITHWDKLGNHLHQVVDYLNTVS